MLNLARYNNSPDRSTKSTTSHLNVLCVLVNTGFQVLFHSPPGVLFTFPSQYCSTIGHQVVFRLGGWSPRLPAGFLVSAGTLDLSLIHIYVRIAWASAETAAQLLPVVPVHPLTASPWRQLDPMWI